MLEFKAIRVANSPKIIKMCINNRIIKFAKSPKIVNPKYRDTILSYLLLETGDKILLETGDKLALEV